MTSALRFASLGSGSKGNATLVCDGETRVLVDCGFGMREAEKRLARFDLHPSQLDAILVSHEHGDHVRGVGALARRYRLPVYLTPGTWRSGRLGSVPTTTGSRRSSVSSSTAWRSTRSRCPTMPASRCSFASMPMAAVSAC
nr:MBL fold metallo-hydrolase [Halomonas socia]